MKEIVILLLRMALMVLVIFKVVASQPVSDEEQLYVSTQLHSFSAVKSIPDTANVEVSNTENATDKMMKRKHTVSKHNLPPSPVGLLRPDTFQFYTFNHNGDVVMKQMSKKEIQSLIASSGGHFPMEIHEPQMVTETSPGETKVADVVQNVQNVLKAELNKPPSVMTSMPTIPGHENSDWSNILPSILSGDMEPDVTSKPDHIHDDDLSKEDVQNATLDSGSGTFSPIKSETHYTKPMIPVAVITVEHEPPSYNSKEEGDGIPVFHMLNTITADKKDGITHKPNQSSTTITELDEISGTSVTVAPCSLMSSNCSGHDLHLMREPDDKLQNDDGLIKKNENETTNNVNPGYTLMFEIAYNETDKNHENEKPKPLILTNTIETKYETQNTVQLNSEQQEKLAELEKIQPSLSINESISTVNLEKGSNSSKKPQSQGENNESNVSESNTRKPVFPKTTNKIEATTAISETLSIPHQIELSHNKVTIINLNSSKDQNTHVGIVTNHFSESQVTDSITDNQNNVFNKTLNISQPQIPEISHDKITTMLPEYVSNKTPSSAASSDYLNATVSTNIPKIHETISSTTINPLSTTIASIPHEKFTSINQVESTKERINNSNPNTMNDAVALNEMVILPTTATPFVSEVSLPNAVSIPTEPIPTELANSLSSMISQISHMMPSIISPPNDVHESEKTTDEAVISDGIDPQPTRSYETTPANFSTENKTMNMSAIHDEIEINKNVSNSGNLTGIVNKLQDNPDKNVESHDEFDAEKKRIIEKIDETPIVRIDIMETMSNIDNKKNVTPVNKGNDDYHDDDAKTESPMVRIKLTDPIAIVNHILESSPVQSSTENGLEVVTMPMDKNIPANGIGSGLIAGFDSNKNESTPSEYLESISDTKANGMVSNETNKNIDSVTKKSAMTMDITTLPTTTKISTEFEDITHVPLPGLKIEPITNSSSTTDVMKTMNLSACSYQNSSSEQKDIGNATLCSTSKDAVQDNNRTVTIADEKYVIPHLQSTTISPNVSTKLFMNNTVVKQKVTTDNTIITELQESKVENTTEMIVTQIPNKTQSDKQISTAHELSTTPETVQPQSVSEQVPELAEFKSENSTSSIEHSMEFGLQSNHTTQHTSLYPHKEMQTYPKLHDTTKNNSNATTPNKMKDKKKDDLQMKQFETVVVGKIEATNSKLDNPSKPIQKPVISNESNLTQDAKTPERWTLIPQENHLNSQNKSSNLTNSLEQRIADIQKESEKSPQTNALSEPKGASGLDMSVEKLDADIAYFSIVCNDLAFKYWNAVNSGLNTSRSIALSPFGMTSILAMLFLGARSPTSDRMNEVLKLDDVTSFNPHLVFQNVTDSVGIAQNQGIANVAFVRELFTDQSKVRKLMRFYKKQAEQFYDGMVEQVNFSTISDAVRRKTNFLVRKQTGGRIRNFVKTNMVPLRSPLAALSANVFQTDCNSNDATSRGRDGELYFAVSPAVRQRKLVLVPATLWKAGVLAGYEPSLDATAYAIGGGDKIVSTIFVIPGQQGSTASDDNLDLLEQRIISGVLHDAAWSKLLRVIVPRPGLELQIPKFSHKSVINATAALKIMGLEELFDQCADFKGINGVGNDFHLADVVQMNLFSTCGDENIQSGKTKHHVEIFPASPQRNARDSKSDDIKADTDDHEIRKNIYNPLKSLETMDLSSTTTTTQIKNEDKPRVKLDKPFLYFVRHNPTGLILFMGRFNPRLLP